MKIFVCFNPRKEKSAKAFPQVIKKLEEFGFEVFIDVRNKPFCKCKSATFLPVKSCIYHCDIFLTIGGDGTILRWGKLAAKARKALLGINTGRLGFMATLECDELDKLKLLAEKKYTTSKRMMLKVQIQKANETSDYLALNDVVLFKGSASKLPEFVVCKDEVEVSRVRADGMIISTSTGSTAYSLSAGGPIIDPQLECFELTSLCSHTLFSRPMIFMPKSRLTAHYTAYENSSVFVTIDGAEGINLTSNDRVVITKSRLYLELIDLDENSFFNSVHNKLLCPLK